MNSRRNDTFFETKDSTRINWNNNLQFEQNIKYFNVKNLKTSKNKSLV